MKKTTRAFFWLAMGVAMTSAHAGEWRISADRPSADRMVHAVVWFAGDGATSDAQVELVHDVIRLQIDSDSWVVGRNEGFCARGSDGRVRVLRFSDDGSIAPPESIPLCDITFRVPENAPAGTATIRGIKAECAGQEGLQPCTAVGAEIQIEGVPPAATELTSPVVSVVVRLGSSESAPSVEAISEIDFGNPADVARVPFAVLRELPPLDATPLLQNRARGQARELIAANPSSPRARLERYVVLYYPLPRDDSNRIGISEGDTPQRVVEELRRELHVEYAAIADEKMSIAAGASAKDGGGAPPYHLSALDALSAWSLVEGWALVGIPDLGLSTQHPSLKSFSGTDSASGTYLGGNFLPYYSFSTVLASSLSPQGVQSTQVDEADPRLASQGEIDEGCSRPFEDPICQLVPGIQAGERCFAGKFIGHGSHVAGLVGGKGSGAADTPGVCPGCGIGSARFSYFDCPDNTPNTGFVRFRTVPVQIAEAVGELTKAGVQVVTMSFFGTANSGAAITCPGLEHWCDVLSLAAARDVVLLGASGNHRAAVQFPASDPRVIAVGGLDEGLAFWREATCPFPQSLNECGSNYTDGLALQELVAPARNVRSTLYRNETYNFLGCGDLYGDEVVDGFGPCTGTSMSSPEVAGLVGLLRSVNPLVQAGSPSPTTGLGLRRLLATTTDRAVQSLGFDPEYGYGLPNAPRAVRGMLGTVRDWPAKNRATPLFSLYSAGYGDYAVTASPQAAVSMMVEEAQVYRAFNGNAFISGELIPGFPLFKVESTQTIDAPRAALYVLTTQNSPRTTYPALLPLYWVERNVYSPAGCVPRHNTACTTTDRDNLLVSNVPDLQTFVNAGYAFKGRQGYVYARCSPEPACMPPGTVKVYRKCTLGNDDCAIFGEPQRGAFENALFTEAFPSGSDMVLGYAYSSGDVDEDGLVDAMEYVIGTSPSVGHQDSDGDGATDSEEYPLADVPTSDPCTEPALNCTIPAELLFVNGFE